MSSEVLENYRPGNSYALGTRDEGKEERLDAYVAHATKGKPVLRHFFTGLMTIPQLCVLISIKRMSNQALKGFNPKLFVLAKH